MQPPCEAPLKDCKPFSEDSPSRWPTLALAAGNDTSSAKCPAHRAPERRFSISRGLGHANQYYEDPPTIHCRHLVTSRLILSYLYLYCWCCSVQERTSPYYITILYQLYLRLTYIGRTNLNRRSYVGTVTMYPFFVLLSQEADHK